MVPEASIAIHEIGFDFDGVVADIGEAFIRIACDDHNYCSFTLDDIVSFQVEQCVSIPQTIIEQIFSDILADSLATGLQPLADAVEVLTSMTECSQVTIITARSMENPVHDWLDTFFDPEAKANINLIAMGDHDKKVQYAREHRLSYFVDDRIETCQQMAAANITPFVYTQPWNKNCANLQTVSSWLQIRTLIDLDNIDLSTDRL